MDPAGQADLWSQVGDLAPTRTSLASCTCWPEALLLTVLVCPCRSVRLMSVFLDVPVHVCKQRATSRGQHPTLAAENAAEVIDR